MCGRTVRLALAFARPEVEVRAVARAIEIVAVGLGQAGGNIAAELYRRGYRALALNTAVSDLSSLAHPSTLLPEEYRMYIGIDGSDGAGANNAYGRECVAHHAQALCERVAEHASGADVVLLIAGVGGGTGSAVSELVRVLEGLSLPVVVVAALPSTHESGIAKVNAVRAVNELVQQNLLGWLFVDNARLAKAHGNLTLDRYYSTVNKLIIEPLDALVQLNRREDLTPIRSLDGQDISGLILSGGNLGFVTFSAQRLSTESLVESVREGLLRNSVQPEGVRLEDVSYLGLVIEAPETLLAHTPFSVFERLSEQLKAETRGGAIHIGVYRNNDPKLGATVRVIASSQSLPDGIQEIVGQARREGSLLRAKLQRGPAGLDLADFEESELLDTGTPVRRRRLRSTDRDEVVSQTTASPASSASALASTLTPYRDAYNNLVKEFQETSSDEVRKRVVNRLEMDRQSDDSLVRYYAVRTMSYLGATHFVEALRSATHDDDSIVRAVALRALNSTL
jgi:cell division GTPase FtsZ